MVCVRVMWTENPHFPKRVWPFRPVIQKVLFSQNASMLEKERLKKQRGGKGRLKHTSECTSGEMDYR